MKSLIADGHNHLEINDSTELAILSGEVLVAPIVTGVCGTDVEIIDGKIDPAFVNYPIVLGHEWCGRVIRVGSDVESIEVGARVVAEGIIPCGICFECVDGNTNRCTTYDEVGFTRAGAAAEQIVVNADLVHVISDLVTNESASLVEPAAVVTQGFMKAQPKKGSKVLVIGDGTIALIAAKLIRNWQPSEVHMLGLKAGQSVLAEQAGVDLFMRNPSAEKYDLIIDASGASSRISEAIRQLVRGGRLLLFGFTGPNVHTPISIDDLINGDLSVFASFGYSRTAWKETVDLMNSGKLDLTFLVTHRFPLEGYREAMDALRRAPSPRGKIIFEIGK
ncbi:MAG TPA: alcohol dehydrogenase catalytic domain-containing protein [Candidatus Paceibacterota bacterium]|nr:alcohol dehydrogenase catalytic domain-containing protein [Candidatus Paceibacterota bacterium]